MGHHSDAVTAKHLEGQAERPPASAEGAVVIGRNEGERLQTCLRSIASNTAVIYVDSGSDDGSPAWARKHGAEVIDLDRQTQFTAARARNAGLRRLREVFPHIRYVQFIDGDCELVHNWLDEARRFLDAHPNVAAVAGRLRERHPDRSIYNWLCDREWDRPAGETRSCGGIAMMRIDALRQIEGFRDDLIAELCFRLRATGWRVWRLSTEMAWHDAGITQFGQWWRRALRSGYASAQGVWLHGASPERYRVWESRRSWLWGVWLPLAGVVAGVWLGPWALALWLLYPLQILRQTVRNTGSLVDRAKLALFQMLSRFPESWGQIRFMRDRLLGQQGNLIEYK